MRPACLHLVAAALACAAGATGCQDNVTPAGSYDPVPPPGCWPDLDGVLSFAELPVAIGVAASFHASPPGQTREVELGGGGGATRRWDFGAEHPDDQLIELVPRSLDDAWYAAEFPGATFAVAQGEIDAIYHLDEQGLWLHGLASAQEAPAGGETLLPYDAAVPVVRLPLEVGDAWTAEATVSAGTLRGLPYVGTDRYEFAADAEGALAVPYVRFAPVVRLRGLVVVTPAAGGVTTSRRTASFLFECFGEIARAESLPDEPDVEFGRAASLRRFAL